MKKEDESLIDVENVETTGKGVAIRANEHNMCGHRNEARFTYIYVYHSNVFEADNAYKNPPLNVISPIFFAIFISLWGSSHDSADC